MKKLLKMMKPGDIVLLLFLVVLSFLPVIIFSYANRSSNVEYNIALISVDGEVLHHFELKDDATREVYVYTDNRGHENTIVREGTVVTISEASCPDQLCVRQGDAYRVGDTLVCLPHRLLIEITSDNPEANSDLEVDITT